MDSIKNLKPGFKELDFKQFLPEEMLKRSKQFYEMLNQRRSVRHFSDKPLPVGLIENIILSAGTAPSGAHKQPWTFCIVESPEIKKKIRAAAEKEEFENYNGRMSDEWLKDLEKFDTDWHKPFLENAPALIVIFKKTYDVEENGKSKNYYVNESVGIATGMLLTAIHQCGLISLTHTPSPLNFLAEVLERPKNEKPYLLIPIGYPSKDALVPTIERKSLTEIMKKY